MMRSNFNMEYENITMTKGDTLAFNVEVFDQNGQPVTVDSADFTCKKDATGEDAVFHQTLGAGIAQSDGILSIRVAPEETMEADAGEYFYDLQLGVNNDVYTVKSGLLTIQQDVTHGNEATGYYDWSMINNKPFNTIGDNLEVDENMVLKAVVPTQLSQLEGDSGHRTVTDTQMLTWNGKQDALTFDQYPTDQSQNPVKSDGIYDSILGVYDALELGLGWDSKNILEIVQSDRENGGITYTFNKKAGTVKLNGTSTGSAVALNKYTGAELKKYGQNLWMSGGRDTSTFLTLATSNWAYTKDDKGTGVEIDITELNDYAEYFVLVQVSSGTVLSNYTMYPMIELVSLTDRRFAPYHGSVDEVKADKTEVIANTQLLTESLGWNNKNELINKAENGTRGTITITHNADDTITLGAGTMQSTDSAYTVNNSLSLKKGKYILSSEAGTANFYLRVSVGGVEYKSDAGQEVPFELASDGTVDVRIFMYRNAVLSEAMTIKPMIRDASILDSTYEPYFGSTAVDWSSYAKTGAVNKLKNEGTTHSYGGITFTVYDDGSFNANGTQDGTGDGSDFYFASSTDKLLVSDYTNMRFTTLVTASDNVAIGVWYYDSNDGYINIQKVTNGEKSFVLNPPTGAVKFLPYVRINKNKAVSNVMFYPMMYSADVPKLNTFAPYAMTNRELTNEMFKSVPLSVLTNGRVLDMSTGSFDLNDVPLGIAVTTNSNAANISHKPSEVTASFTVFTLEQYAGFRYQIMILRDNPSVVFRRTRNNSNIWESWYKFTGTSVS